MHESPANPAKYVSEGTSSDMRILRAISPLSDGHGHFRFHGAPVALEQRLLLDGYKGHCSVNAASAPRTGRRYRDEHRLRIHARTPPGPG